MSEHVIKGSDQNFSDEVLGSEIPVLVDFWADWCAPCRMIGPFMEQLAKEYDGKLKVVKCNVDECTSTATTYGISSIPNLMIFKGGKPVKNTTGAMPLAQLKIFVESEL